MQSNAEFVCIGFKVYSQMDKIKGKPGSGHEQYSFFTR